MQKPHVPTLLGVILIVVVILGVYHMSARKKG